MYESFDAGRDAEAFFARLHTWFTGRESSPQVLRLNIQPGDATRYEIVLARDGDHVAASMVQPEPCAYHFRLSDMHVDLYRNAFTGLRAHTLGLLQSVISGVCWGASPEHYDFARAMPSPEAIDAARR